MNGSTAESRTGSSSQEQRAGSALGWGLLVYMSFAVVLITWAPFSFSVPDSPDVVLFATVQDVVVNLALFFPLGFLFSASLAGRGGMRRARWSTWLALGFGVLFSASIEAGQLLLESRCTSPWDVLTNAFGAVAGAEAHRRIKGVLDRGLGEGLALELPLMNVVYLLSLLALIDSLAAVGQTHRGILALVLGLCCGHVLAALWRHRIHQSMRSSLMVLISAIWFVAVTLPLLFTDVWIVPTGAAATSLLVWALVRRGPVIRGGRERRFEARALRSVGVCFVSYLLLLALWPLPSGLTAWRGEVALSGFSPDPTIGEILRFLELIGAFTLGGFMLAEGRGRRSEPFATSLGAVIAVAVAVSTVLECARGAHPLHHASLIQSLVSVAGAAAGAVLYRLQLNAVRGWLSRRQRALAPVFEDAAVR